MDASNKELVTSFHKFVQQIKKSDKIAIFHDLDPDGICSGVITAHAIERLRGKKTDFFITQKPGEIPLTKKTISIIKKKKINILITTDKAVDQDKNSLLEAAKHCRILVFDHHKMHNTFPDHKKILMLKPQLLKSKTEPSRYCTAKLAYDAWSLVADISDAAWKACPGIIGDIAYTAWKPFVDAQLRKWKSAVTSDPFENLFGKIAEMISHIECYDHKKMGMVFNALFRASNPLQFLSSSLKKYSSVIKKEIQYYLDHAPDLAEYFPNKKLIIYFIKSKHHIKSNISTILSMKHRHETLLVCSDEGKEVHLSLRRQDCAVKMNELAEKALQGLHGTGGGHIPAAGGRVAKKDYPEFKKRIIEMSR